jgi:hypothetical protein
VPVLLGIARPHFPVIVSMGGPVKYTKDTAGTLKSSLRAFDRRHRHQIDDNMKRENAVIKFLFMASRFSSVMCKSLYILSRNVVGRRRFAPISATD